MARRKETAPAQTIDQLIERAKVVPLETPEQILAIRKQLESHFATQLKNLYGNTNVFLRVASQEDSNQEVQHFCHQLDVDLLFYTFPNKPAFISLPVTTGQSSDSDVTIAQVAGIIFPHPGESIVGAQKRAQITQRQLAWSINRTLANANGSLDFHPQVVVANPTNLTLWLENALPMQVTTSELNFSTSQLCEILTLGLDKLLGADQYVLQINALETHEFEVAVYYPTGKLICLDFVGLKKQATVKKDATFEAVNQVIGMRCTPDSLSDEGRIEKTRRDMKSMRVRLIDKEQSPKAKVLSVTSSLLKRWDDLISTGDNFCQLSELEPDENAIENHPDHSDHREQAELSENENQPILAEQITSTPGNIKGLRYVTHEQGPSGIGAKPSFLEILYHDGHVGIITLDAGAIYEGFSWSGPFKPSMEEGIAPFQELLPQVPLWFRLTLLLKAAERQGVSFLSLTGIDPAELSHGHFQLLDIFHRLRPTDFKRFCKALAKVSQVTIEDAEIEDLQNELQIIAANTVFKDRVEQQAFIISHFHDDHIGFAATVSSEIPQFISAESTPWIKFFAARSAWMYEVSERMKRATLLDESKGKHYRPPIFPLLPYETKFIKNEVSITCLPADHSIYGMAMFLITLYNEIGLPIYTVLYTGDYRFGDQGVTEKTAEILSKIKVDSVITDTTNLGANENIKPKNKTSPEKMLHTYQEIFEKATGPVIIQLDPKDLETAFIISLAVNQANKNGKSRQLVYNLRQAAAANLFLQNDQASDFFMADQVAQQQTANTFMNLEDREVLDEPYNLVAHHPRPRLSGQVKILDSHKHQYSSIEQAVLQEYESAMTTIPVLISRKEMAQTVLIIPPYKSLRQEFQSIGRHMPDATACRAHFFTYDPDSKKQAKDDRDFCYEMGWKHESDLVFKNNTIYAASEPRFRMGGHAQAKELLEFLGMLYAKNPEMLTIPVHGLHRGGGAEVIESWMAGQLGISAQVIKRMSKGTFERDLF